MVLDLSSRSMLRGPKLVHMLTEPTTIFQDIIAVTVPHMDDGVLGCGGTLAQLPDKQRIHVIYATDGAQSPTPMFPWQGPPASDLAAIRMEEAKAALAVVGIPETNIHFLAFPDGKLRQVGKALHQSLLDLFARIRPEQVLTPFRYDRHPDHLALNRATTAVLQHTFFDVQMFEYFIYYRWKLLPKGDVRAYIRADHLVSIDIAPEAERKRQALACFRSQTTRFYAWQDRPILTAALLDEVCHEPERFLRCPPRDPKIPIFTKLHPWIRLVHRTEPVLKKRKDEVVTLLRRGLK